MHYQSVVPVALAAALLVAAPVSAQTTGSAGTGAEAQTGSTTGAGTTAHPSHDASGSTPVPGGASASTGVTAGASVYDPQGGVVGTIEAVEAGQAVLSTGAVKVRVPVTGFAQGAKGLTIAMTKQEVEAAAGKAR